jgi:hypothetical protein
MKRFIIVFPFYIPNDQLPNSQHSVGGPLTSIGNSLIISHECIGFSGFLQEKSHNYTIKSCVSSLSSFLFRSLIAHETVPET